MLERKASPPRFYIPRTTHLKTEVDFPPPPRVSKIVHGARQGMAGEAMAYPLRYGYSLVGRVVECGRGVESEKLLGKLVFTFSPHCSWVTADADSVMIVPEVGVYA